MIETVGKLFWRFVKAVLEFIVFKIMHLQIDEAKWASFLQFMKFSVVGLSNTVVHYVIYVICLLLFEKAGLFPSTDYLIAQVIAFALSVLWSFYWNRKFVFRADNEKVPWPQALLKTYISYAFTGLFLNSVLAVFWVQVVHIPKLFAPIANLLISVPINYFLNKLWAFREKN